MDVMEGQGTSKFQQQQFEFQQHQQQQQQQLEHHHQYQLLHQQPEQLLHGFNSSSISSISSSSNNISTPSHAVFPVFAMASVTQDHHHNSNNSSVTDDPILKAIRHAHWDNFQPQPYSTHLAIGITMSILGLVAVSTNSFVMYIFLR